MPKIYLPQPHDDIIKKDTKDRRSIDPKYSSESLDTQTNRTKNEMVKN